MASSTFQVHRQMNALAAADLPLDELGEELSAALRGLILVVGIGLECHLRAGKCGSVICFILFPFSDLVGAPPGACSSRAMSSH
jgi:hypothetical protein